jgi:hypothetical protein
MKSPALLLALTVVNLGLLGAQLLRTRDAAAADEPGVLRGRGLELVDEQGRVRAQLQVLPADPTYRWPDGSRVGYPDTVILRMSSPDGKPRVKLTTSEQGSSLMLLGDSDTTQSILFADGKTSRLRLRDDEKTQRLLGP